MVNKFFKKFVCDRVIMFRDGNVDEIRAVIVRLSPTRSTKQEGDDGRAASPPMHFSVGGY